MPGTVKKKSISTHLSILKIFTDYSVVLFFFHVNHQLLWFLIYFSLENASFRGRQRNHIFIIHQPPVGACSVHSQLELLSIVNHMLVDSLWNLIF